MTVKIRRGKLSTDPFTIVPNGHARDKRLSWAARGLLVWLRGHAASFEITEEKMIEAGDLKRDGIRKLVRELETHSYLRRDKKFTPGVGTSVAYILMDPDDGDSVVSDDGDSAVRADQGEQDLFAVQPYDGKSVPPPYIEDQKKNKKTSSSTTKRGTRVPDDFQPTDEMKAWFAGEGFQHLIHGRTEHEKFMDYWRSAPGAKGVKLDWPATWRNWMRTAAERSQGTGYSRPVSAPPGNSLVPAGAVPPVGAYRPSTTDQKVLQTIELGRRLQQQMEETQ